MGVQLIEVILVDRFGLWQPQNVERNSVVGAEVAVEQVGLHPEEKANNVYSFFCEI